MVRSIELFEITSLRETFTTDTNNFKSSTVAQLLHDQRGFEEMRRLLGVGLDAFDVMRMRAAEGCHEVIQLRSKH
jgi:hypothetical protein